MKQTFLKNSKYEILGQNGWENFDGIVVTEKELLVKNITTASKKWIECSNDHILYDENSNEIRTEYLSIGDGIQTIDGVEYIEKIDESVVDVVYDIFNSDSHQIFTNGIKNHQCDEFAKVPQNIGSDFFASIFPTLSSIPDSKIIIVSTPKGMFNLFHELYTAAEKGRNSFVYYSANWRCVPWKDDEWAKQERKNIGSDARWMQEYEVEFLGSSSTVIIPDILGHLFEDAINPQFMDLEDRLRIYEKPLPNMMYLMGVDTGKGTGNDASTIQILKVISTNPIKCEQIAVFEHDKTDVYQFSEIVNRLSYYYNNAIMFVENNAEAAPVVNNLWYTFENMNLFCKGQDLGVRATKGTKTKAVLLMKKLIEEGSLILHDGPTIKELGSFIEEKGRFFGKDLHDDLVSGLYWACYAFEEKDIFDISPQLINSSEDQAWGILADIANNPDEDWSWLNQGEEQKPEDPNEWLRGN